MPDISQELKDAENALRDFIAQRLTKSLGTQWIEFCGVTAERIEKWKERKKIEEKRLSSTGVVDERLIYYADFYDLRTILKCRWAEDFSEVFGKWKQMEVWLDTLEEMRNPEAHRRELLPHQKHLAAGISGEIRTRIVRSRSQEVSPDAFFPRIESARDNHGNVYFGDSKSVSTGIVLHPGDELQFVITASDPYGEMVEYGIMSTNGIMWSE